MSIGGGVWSAAVDESSCMSWVVCVGDRWYRLVGRVGNVYGAIWLEVSGWLHDCINELKMRLEFLEVLWDALRHEIKSCRIRLEAVMTQQLLGTVAVFRTQVRGNTAGRSVVME
jgi:hypothetical protein